MQHITFNFQKNISFLPHSHTHTHTISFLSQLCVWVCVGVCVMCVDLAANQTPSHTAGWSASRSRHCGLQSKAISQGNIPTLSCTTHTHTFALPQMGAGNAMLIGMFIGWGLLLTSWWMLLSALKLPGKWSMSILLGSWTLLMLAALATHGDTRQQGLEVTVMSFHIILQFQLEVFITHWGAEAQFSVQSQRSARLQTEDFRQDIHYLLKASRKRGEKLAC